MSKLPLLSIQHLCVDVIGKAILEDISLEVNGGEVHVLIGPNGAGKSSLGHVVAGKPGYDVRSGKVWLNGKEALEMSPEKRVHTGLFVAFQDPVAIPGVSNMHFLKTAINAGLEAKGLPKLDSSACLAYIKKGMQELELPLSFLSRSVNHGFSGGEKKRNELLQMVLLKPQIVVLDETDAGLDVEARTLLGKVVRDMQERGAGIVVITHYADFLRYIQPSMVHVMQQGKIVASGNIDLGAKILEGGYNVLGLVNNAK